MPLKTNVRTGFGAPPIVAAAYATKSAPPRTASVRNLLAPSREGGEKNTSCSRAVTWSHHLRRVAVILLPSSIVTLMTESQTHDDGRRSLEASADAAVRDPVELLQGPHPVRHVEPTGQRARLPRVRRRSPRSRAASTPDCCLGTPNARISSPVSPARVRLRRCSFTAT